MDRETDDRWRKSVGTFRAELSITDRHEQLEEDWLRSVSSGSFPTIYLADKVSKGQTVHVVLVFKNCLKIENDECSMWVDFVVRRPDGGVHSSYMNQPLWSGKPPAPDLMFLGGPYLAFEPEPLDEEGIYCFTAIIHDADSSHAVEVGRTLMVREMKLSR